MRRPIASIACALALVTGVWFGQAYALFAPPNALVASSTHDWTAEAAVWRFYDAVDTLLRTGDDTGLRAALAPGFVDHAARPGLPPTRDGLVRYLTALPITFPDLRLVPGELLVQGDRVVAQVAFAGATSGSFFGIPLAGSSPWTAIDVFRVSDGQIVEHWGDAQGLVVAETLFSDTLTVPPGSDLIPSLERLTIAPDASDARYQHGPAVVLAETGAVEVALDNALATLAPGEAIAVSAGVFFAARNRTDSAAVVLVLRLKPSVWPAAVGEPAPTPATLPPGITSEILVDGASAATEPGPHTVAFGRVTLAPGAQLATHQTAGAELLLVEDGRMTAMFPGDSTRYWVYPPHPGAPASGDLALLAPSTGLSVSPNVVASYRNDEVTTLSLLVVTIVPAMATSR